MDFAQVQGKQVQPEGDTQCVREMDDPNRMTTSYPVHLSDSDRILTPEQEAQAALIKVDLMLGRAKLVPRSAEKGVK